MPHWHDVNPWRDDVVYVPLTELAACAAGGTIQKSGGGSEPYDVARVLKHLRQNGDKLDAYILPQPSGNHSLGVRYGAEDHEYYSPRNANPELTQQLLERYRTT